MSSKTTKPIKGIIIYPRAYAEALKKLAVMLFWP